MSLIDMNLNRIALVCQTACLYNMSCASSVLVIASNLVDESQEAIFFYILSCNESELSLFRHVVPS